MKIKPLYAALIVGSFAATAVWSGSSLQANEGLPPNPAVAPSEIESTAPGPEVPRSSFEGIPELESSTEIQVPPVIEPRVTEPRVTEPTTNLEVSDIDAGETNTSEQEFDFDPSFDSESAPTTRQAVRRERLDPQTFNTSEKILAKAIRTVEDFMGNPKTKIEAELLRQSEGIVIFPDILQAGFFLGGRRGSGILVLRNNDGTWSNPGFITITGGSLGLQIGAKSSDLILVFPQRRMVHEAFAGSYKLGGDVSGTAGALGRSPVKPSEEYSKDKVYAISRSSGLFGGISLDGSELNFNRKRNVEFYGADLTPREIFAEIPSVDTPRMVPPLQDLLSQVESGTFRLF